MPRVLLIVLCTLAVPALRAQDTTQADTVLDVNKPTNFNTKGWKPPRDSSWQKAQRISACYARFRRGEISEQATNRCAYGKDYDPRTGRFYDTTAAMATSSGSTGDIVVYYKVTEQNDVYWRVAWRLPLKNKSDSPVRFGAVIKFLDADGFEVADDRVYGLSLGAREEREFTGATLIRLPAAATVARARVEFEP